MRTMQRLRHVRPPDEHEVRRIHSAERRKISRKENRIWVRRLRNFTRLASILLLIALLSWWLLGGRFTADALVESNLVVARAPASVRVAEVYCRQGQRCAVGTPLVRLESLAPAEDRRPLELALEQRRLRLELVLAGGDLGDTDIARRAERFAEAERELENAENDRLLALASLESLLRRRAALELTLREERTERGGVVASLEERVAEAQALVEGGLALTSFTDWDVYSRTELNVEGVLSDRATAEALQAQGVAEGEVKGRSAAARAVAKELEAARAIAALGQEKLDRSLAEVDAEVEVARTRARAAADRRDQWFAAAGRLREMGAAEGEGEAARLRAIELRLLAVEVAEAEARLAEYDRGVGELVLESRSEGIVERVLAQPGAVYEGGAELVRLFDPAGMHVVAYLDQDQTAKVTRGQSCLLMPLGSSQTFHGRVESIDAVWTPCPPFLPSNDVASTDLRLPVHIACDALDQLTQLGPNMRVRVLFKDEAPEPARAGGR